jgi:PIF1-like helicase/Helitron helicase-like domain at N-terminus
VIPTLNVSRNFIYIFLLFKILKMPESESQKKKRSLEKNRQRYHLKRSLMTDEEKDAERKKRKANAAKEGEEHRRSRLDKHNEHMRQVRTAESSAERNGRRLLDAQHHAQNRTAESSVARIGRLADQSIRTSQHRAAESSAERSGRLLLDSQRHARTLAAETPQARAERLQRLREAYAERSASAEEFIKAITSYCEKVCEICLKRCYFDQVAKFTSAAQSFLPAILQNKELLLCHRCKTHLGKNKQPAKAFWNKLDPGVIPDEIKVLTQPERRLLSRIIPYIKIIKYGRFDQYSFKGHATLFALDIFEVSEKLPEMLPRNSDEIGIVVITESLENSNPREYQISRERVYNALDWLIANDPLYHDVTINRSARLETQDVMRVVPPAQSNAPQAIANPAVPHVSAYKSTGKPESRIVRSSWHQGNSIFKFPGVQCFAMALANIVRAAIIPPSRWNSGILDSNMVAGDDFYYEINEATKENENAAPIDPNGFLMLENLDVIGYAFSMYNHSILLSYDTSWIVAGSLVDNVNEELSQRTLLAALQFLFTEHNAGILIAEDKCLGVLKCDEKFYFTDSHPCGPSGAPCRKRTDNGKACIIECDTEEELLRVIRRVLPSVNRQFSLHYIDVKNLGEIRTMTMDEYNREHEQSEQPTVNFAPEETLEAFTQHVPIQTSVMAPIDVVQPDVEEVIEESSNLNEIVRKTGNNIVNINREKKAEEFAWWFLFPYGINGLNEEREIRITPLDYFQSRILGTDPRFQRIDYLFYALAITEFHRVNGAISTCVKKIQGRDGAVEDVHLVMRSLRGSGAYWKQALNELIGQIRCLGPPTWFITLSCNDLHWLDMIKALLIADNDARKDEDEPNIVIDDVQKLIEQYPVVVSRHFMRRIKAFMKFIQANERVLGGKVSDFWWRIEFQNRGSPHLHLLVWIDKAPSFESPEGIRLIDDVISCNFPTEEEDEKLHNLVKACQKHDHRATCYKNNSESCRFGFPRPVSATTRIVSQTSDEFIRNSGRICVLKRKQGDEKINNYNPTILELWNGNMDIQPCGTNEAIAHYIAKYIAKSEPTNLNESVAQAIQQIRREESDISRKMFKVCMRIIKERHVSACEAAYRLCHLNMRGSSRECVHMNTRMPEERYRTVRFEGNQAVGLHANMMERYEKRPRERVDEFDFPNMCALEFHMRFAADYQKDDNENVDAEIETNRPRRRRITLADGTKMVVRNVLAVVKRPYFVLARDPKNFFYSPLVEYIPFYNETELLEGYADPQEAFLGHEEQLRQMSVNLRAIRERDQQLEDALVQAHAFEILERPEEIPQEIEELSQAQGMTDIHFQAGKAKMNVKQTELFHMIKDSILNQQRGSSDRLHLFVTGGAGVGKTFTFKLLVELINRTMHSDRRTAVQVGALTGVAARLVEGRTLHSMFKLPIEKSNRRIAASLDPLSGNYLKVMRQQWRDIEYVFIDEISMVSDKMLYFISSRLGQLKHKETVPFGGINVVFFGDLMQLPPVNGMPVFFKPFNCVFHLWGMFTLVELTENMRQQGDTTFADLLNALRVGKMSSQHFSLLMSKKLTSEDLAGDFAVEKVIRIYPTRAQVEIHNNAVLELHRSNGSQIFKIKANDRLVDTTRNTENVDMDKIVPSDINETGGYPKWLEIFVGAKVMLRANISVVKGLVNGAMGHITKIIWPYFRRDQMYQDDIPKVVEIDFEGIGLCEIEPKAVQFDAKFNYGKIERIQLPLILCWACTVHKMQGCTVDKAVVYLGSKLFANGQAYVALSRVRSLEGLRIEELDNSKLTGTTPCNINALNEMERMRNLQPPDQQ